MVKKTATKKKQISGTIDNVDKENTQPNNNLVDQLPIISGIDVGEANPAALPPEQFIQQAIPVEPVVEVQKIRDQSYGSNNKLNSLLRARKTIIEKKLAQYEAVYKIFKAAGNFNRDFATTIASRLSEVYGFSITFDNNQGLFLFWNSNTKSFMTLDIFGGFGVITIGGLNSRNRFASNFNFSQWSLNIYGPLANHLKSKLAELDDLSSGRVYDAVAVLMESPADVVETAISLLKENSR